MYSTESLGTQKQNNINI